MRIYYSLCLAILMSGSITAQAYDAQTIRDYIDRYKYIAVQEMEDHGIPASITLSQGILESGAGTSQLAAKSNNHFGIKCHKGWKGGKVYHDDDAKGECFRKYRNAASSFEDHSAFLTGRSRYAFLFEYKKTDYKAWARGLKKAGYATNPKYANLLISLIEDYNLTAYDRGLPAGQLASAPKGNEATVLADTPPMASYAGEIFHYNRIKTVKVQAGDTPEKLANAHGIRLSWLLRYNNLLRGDEQLKTGTHFYLQPKRRKGANKYHVVKAGESMASISRDEGILLEVLYKRNLVDRGFEPAEGEQLYLRKNRLKPPASRGNENRNLPVTATEVSPEKLALPAKSGKSEPKKESKAPFGINKDKKEKKGPFGSKKAPETQKPETQSPTLEQPEKSKVEVIEKAPEVPNKPAETPRKTEEVTTSTAATLPKTNEKAVVKPTADIPAADMPKVDLPKAETTAPAVEKPAIERHHTVAAGETLYALSKRFNTSVEELMRLNGLKNYNLSIGQKLIVGKE